MTITKTIEKAVETYTDDFMRAKAVFERAKKAEMAILIAHKNLQGELKRVLTDLVMSHQAVKTWNTNYKMYLELLASNIKQYSQLGKKTSEAEKFYLKLLKEKQARDKVKGARTPAQEIADKAFEKAERAFGNSPEGYIMGHISDMKKMTAYYQTGYEEALASFKEAMENYNALLDSSKRFNMKLPTYAQPKQPADASKSVIEWLSKMG